MEDQNNLENQDKDLETKVSAAPANDQKHSASSSMPPAATEGAKPKDEGQDAAPADQPADDSAGEDNKNADSPNEDEGAAAGGDGESDKPADADNGEGAPLGEGALGA